MIQDNNGFWIDKQIKEIPLNTPVFITNGNGVIMCEIIAEVLRFRNRKGKLYTEYTIKPIGFQGYEWDWDFEFIDITHWAPLPEEVRRLIK